MTTAPFASVLLAIAVRFNSRSSANANPRTSASSIAGEIIGRAKATGVFSHCESRNSPLVTFPSPNTKSGRSASLFPNLGFRKFVFELTSLYHSLDIPFAAEDERLFVWFPDEGVAQGRDQDIGTGKFRRGSSGKGA